MRLCGIGGKGYMCISSPFAVPDFPDTIDVILSSAKISSSTSDGIGLPFVQPGTFSLTAAVTASGEQVCYCFFISLAYISLFPCKRKIFI